MHHHLSRRAGLLLLLLLLLLLWQHTPGQAQSPTEAAPNLLGNGYTYGPTWSPDGEHLLINTNTTIFYQDTTADNAPLVPLDAHPDTVWDIVFTPDSTRFFTAGAEGVINAWDTATLTTTHAFPLADVISSPNPQVERLHISPDGRLLIAALRRTGPHWYAFIDLAANTLLPQPGNTTMHYSLGGGRLQAIGLAGAAGAVTVWGYADGAWQPVQSLPSAAPGSSFTNWLSSDGQVAFEHDTTLNQVRVFALESGALLTTVLTPPNSVYFGADVVPFFTDDDSEAVQLWTADATLRYPRPPTANFVRFVELAANDRLLVFADAVSLQTIIDRRDANTISGVLPGQVLRAFSPSGDTYAVVRVEQQTGERELVLGSPTGIRPAVPQPGGEIYRLYLSPDGQRLYVLLRFNPDAPTQDVVVYDMRTGRISTRLTLPAEPTSNRLAFNPATNAAWRVAGGVLTPIDADTNTAADSPQSPQVTLPGLQAAVVDYRYTPDGAGMVVAGGDQRLRRYDIATQTERWQTARIAPIRTLAVGDGMVGLLTEDHGLAVFALADGAQLLYEPVPAATTLAYSSAVGFIVASSSQVTALQPGDPATIRVLATWTATGVSSPSVLRVGPAGEIAVAGFAPNPASDAQPGPGQTQVVLYASAAALRNDDETARITLPGQFVTDMAFAAAGTRLVVANAQLRVFDASTGELLWQAAPDFVAGGLAVADGYIFSSAPNFAVAGGLSVHSLEGEYLGDVTVPYSSRGGGGGGSFIERVPVAAGAGRVAHHGRFLIADWNQAAAVAAARAK